MDKMIEVQYEGVVIARTTVVRELDTRGVFLGVTEPLPVGTTVALRVGSQGKSEIARGKVDAVVESSEMSRAGMRVRFSDASAAALFGTPVEAPPEPAPPIEPAAVEGPAAVVAASTAATPGAAGGAADRQGVVAEESSPASTVSAGHRRIIVDASTESSQGRSQESSQEPSDDAPSSPAATDADGLGGDSGRIPAPDPSAFGGGGGGKKGRRHKRR